VDDVGPVRRLGGGESDGRCEGEESEGVFHFNDCMGLL
jgi:hypothetical protein